MSGSRILITGASGFLGRVLVSTARAAGHPVIALLRGAPDPGWAQDPQIRVETLDLAAESAQSALPPLLQDVTAVIHTAARMNGTDAEHARDTVGATAAVIGAIMAAEGTPRLVLVSSLSVYGVAALPFGAVIDEHSPIERETVNRDAYCRAKLKQENLVIQATREKGLTARLMRVGLLYSPGHFDVSRLGVRVGSMLIMPHGRATIPAIHVADCATALVAAATGPMGPNDLQMPDGAGTLDIINLVAPHPPSQSDWLAAVGEKDAKVLRLPLKPLLRVGRWVDRVSAMMPSLGRRLPGLLHEATLAARFKPLIYSSARAEARLGFRPAHDFAEELACSREAT